MSLNCQCDTWHSELKALKVNMKFSHSLKSAEGQSLHTLDFRIKETQKQIKSLKLQLKTLSTTIYSHAQDFRQRG